jgi:hypothetical protein
MAFWFVVVGDMVAALWCVRCRHAATTCFVLYVWVGIVQYNIPNIEASDSSVPGQSELLVLELCEPHDFWFGIRRRVWKFVLKTVAKIAQISIFRIHGNYGQWKIYGNKCEEYQVCDSSSSSSGHGVEYVGFFLMSFL